MNKNEVKLYGKVGNKKMCYLFLYFLLVSGKTIQEAYLSCTSERA